MAKAKKHKVTVTLATESDARGLDRPMLGQTQLENLSFWFKAFAANPSATNWNHLTASMMEYQQKGQSDA